MHDKNRREPIEHAIDTIISTVLVTDRRLLLFGETGIGKSTLAANLAKKLAQANRTCFCLSADPGSPAFGVPGTIGLGKWQSAKWQPLHLEALCSLDAGRFRLPLVSAVRRLAERLDRGTLLIDAPGVVRGVAGAELLAALVEAAAVDAVLVLHRKEKGVPLAPELAALGVDVYFVEAAPEARVPGKRQRSRHRGRLWDAYLANAVEQTIRFSEVTITGTPPPWQAKDEWQGRQLALISQQETLALGEVIAVREDSFHVRMPVITQTADTLLIRDACRDEKGKLSTSKPFASTSFQFVPPPDVMSAGTVSFPTGPRPVVHIGSAVGILVNGLWGDPLLHVRLGNQKRSILFDLGEGGRLPAKIAHQVTDVFITHSHFDHISGFLWLLRSRIGNLPKCRIYGPPGLAECIENLINGITWDRVGEWGPRFKVTELHGDKMYLWNIQAGRKDKAQPEKRYVNEGILCQETLFTIRGVTLDHGIPVLAYSFEHSPQLKIRKDRLAAAHLTPGPWLQQLKSYSAVGDHGAKIHLPDGTHTSVGALAAELINFTPGQKLVYATDFADTQANREKLIAFADSAHTFFCEAAFIEADSVHARRTGHLTIRACGEIAGAAGVTYLIPFHFSKRYAKDPGPLYDEIKTKCSQAVLPKYYEPA